MTLVRSAELEDSLCAVVEKNSACDGPAGAKRETDETKPRREDVLADLLEK